MAYIRVSTTEQADLGVSLEAQRAKVTAYADLYELAMVAIEEDAGESAKSLDRPALQRALAMLRRGDADTMLVVDLDRLTRSLRDWQDLLDDYFIRGKYTLRTVDGQVDTRTADGRMVLNVRMSVKQHERERIGERTSAAMQHKKTKGEYTGGLAPYGFAIEGDALVRVDAEQAVIAEARKLRATGLSLRAVAAMLDERGIRSRTGRAFAAKQIARMTQEAA